jgi:Fic family protein
MNNKFTKRQNLILNQLKFRTEYTISEIQKFENLEETSISSLKRDLKALVENKFLKLLGERKTAKYILTEYALLHRSFQVDTYFKDEIFRRNIIEKYNFDLLNILENNSIFTEEEICILQQNTKIFKEKSEGASETILKKELERFTIELSWKSSKIEGNTYTLLDTEKLIREGVESVTNTKEEAIMILNHKKSLNYILESIKLEKNLESFRELENIHRLLVLDLGINHGLRSRAVGITGTKYLPLDMFSQIENETKRFVETIKKQKNNFSKALISILFISYLQSFEDGNKRTARLYANAMLLSAGLAPLSYRDVDEKKYREAILIFYEQNSVEAFKEIFIEQYIFSCNTYNLG